MSGLPSFQRWSLANEPRDCSSWFELNFSSFNCKFDSSKSWKLFEKSFENSWAKSSGGGIIGNWARHPDSSVTLIDGAIWLTFVWIISEGSKTCGCEWELSFWLGEEMGEVWNDCGGVKVRPKNAKGEFGNENGECTSRPPICWLLELMFSSLIIWSIFCWSIDDIAEGDWVELGGVEDWLSGWWIGDVWREGGEETQSDLSSVCKERIEIGWGCPLLWLVCKGGEEECW